MKKIFTLIAAVAFAATASAQVISFDTNVFNIIKEFDEKSSQL